MYFSTKSLFQSTIAITKKLVVYWQNINVLFAKKPYYCMKELLFCL